MLEQEQKYASRGWIVNTASVQGLVPYYGTPSYCASKGAAVMLTKQVALDYAKEKIHCNALAPGFLASAMTQNLQGDEESKEKIEKQHPFGEALGRVEDVAKAAIFLASDDAAWITGGECLSRWKCLCSSICLSAPASRWRIFVALKVQ